MPSHTHVLLVSGQPTPNLTPALDPDLAPKGAILVVSPDMAQQADWLERVLRPRGIATERWTVDDPWDVEHLRLRFLELLERRADEHLVLNVTCGTKPMAIAAYEEFRETGRPIFYVHPERDRLIWMHPSHLPPRELANRVKLDAFLLAHGAELTDRPAEFGMPENLRQLAEQLVGEVGRYQSALGTLNWLAAEARETLLCRVPASGLGNAAVRDLLDWFEAEGLLGLSGDLLRFADETARSFAHGGWLEQHVHAVVQTVRRDIGGIQDIGRGLTVTRQVGSQSVPNELDVAFLAENRLYVIECKTRKFGDEPDAGGIGAEAVYRLDALANLLGGLRGAAMLVSYRPLAPNVLNRARDYGIPTCAGPELPDLNDRIRRWLR